MAMGKIIHRKQSQLLCAGFAPKNERCDVGRLETPVLALFPLYFGANLEVMLYLRSH